MESYNINELLAKLSIIEEENYLLKTKKYGLIFEDKPEEIADLLYNYFPVLVPNKDLDTDESMDIVNGDDEVDHLVIEGDNYHALMCLMQTHKGKIDLIIIDPPYCTDKKEFSYNDSFVDSNDIWKHSKWLSFISKRLFIAKELLSKDGVIVVHIDEHEFAQLKMLMDNIFGHENDLGNIIWNKMNPKGDPGVVSIMNEFLFCYAKSKEEFLKLENTLTRPKPNAVKILNKARRIFAKIGRTLVPEEILEIVKPFNYSKEILDDFKVTYDLDLVNKEFQNWLSRQPFTNGEKAYKFIDEQGDVYQSVSMAWPNKKTAPEEYYIPLIHPITEKECPVPQRGWRNPPDTMKFLLDSKLILFGADENTQPRRKYLLREHMSENTPSIFEYGGSDDALFTSMGISFPYAKPVDVEEYLITSIHPDPKIVLDFFAGSGTICHSVMQINKQLQKKVQCILCTNNEVDCDTVALLSKRGLKKGDKEFEKNGVFRAVTHPRISNVSRGYTNIIDSSEISGLGGNIRIFQGYEKCISENTSLVPFDISASDFRTRATISRRLSNMLFIKENVFNNVNATSPLHFEIAYNSNKIVGVYPLVFEQDELNEITKFLMASKQNEKVLYLFMEKENINDHFIKTLRKSAIKVVPIPEDMIRIYRQIIRRNK